MEELKRNLETYKIHNICKSCSRSRAVVTVNITNAKLIGETPDITKDERNFGCLLAKGNLQGKTVGRVKRRLKPPSEEEIGLDLTYVEEGLTEHYAAGSRLEPTGNGIRDKI